MEPYDVLNHSGVLGMKHGVRKWQFADGTWTEAGKARRRKMEGGGKAKSSKKVESKKSSSATQNRQGDTRKKSIRDMSDDEIKEEINRLQLTKQLKTLRSENQSRGAKFALNVLEDIGKQSLVNIGTQATTHFLGVAINDLFGVGDIHNKDYIAKRIVNPQKGQGSDGDKKKDDKKKDD